VKSLITISTTILLCTVLFSSCNHEAKKSIKATIPNHQESIVAKSQDKVDTTTAIMIDTLYFNFDSVVYRKVRYLVKPPAITPLPLGYSGNSKVFMVINKFYADLVCKDCYVPVQGCIMSKLSNIKLYKLPVIKTLDYVQTGQREADTCEDGKPFGNYLKLNKYRYRLPDVSNYQCYYWCDYDSQTHLYKDATNSNCSWIIPSFYFGYLIFYDPKTLNAKVLIIYYDTFQDGSADYRHFIIDKDYTIHLIDFTAPSDDPGDDPEHPSKYEDILIKVLKNGKIVVKN
jgi:hypothetical protein